MTRTRATAAPRSGLALAARGALVLACAGCEVVQEVGRDTVKLVDTVARVDTLVRTDTVVVPDMLWGIGDDLAASALATLADSSGPLAALPPVMAPPVPLAAGVAPPPPAAPSGPPAAGSAGPAAATANGARPPVDTATPAVTNADLTTLHARRLLVPVAGVRAAGLPDTFSERRGSRAHEALDILAPRGTPVLSADAGRVVKLYTSAAGGLTLYAADPSGRYMYYYAHLDRYHPRMRDGMTLARGDTLGTVGTSGNAAPTVPHLHFAIARIADPRQWWKGAPINPHTLLTDGP